MAQLMISAVGRLAIPKFSNIEREYMFQVPVLSVDLKGKHSIVVGNARESFQYKTANCCAEDMSYASSNLQFIPNSTYD